MDSSNEQLIGMKEQKIEAIKADLVVLEAEKQTMITTLADIKHAQVTNIGKRDALQGTLEQTFGDFSAAKLLKHGTGAGRGSAKRIGRTMDFSKKGFVASSEGKIDTLKRDDYVARPSARTRPISLMGKVLKGFIELVQKEGPRSGPNKDR